MPDQAAISSTTAIPALLRRPEPAGKTVRARSGTRNTETRAPALRPAQVPRAGRRYQRLLDEAQDENLRSLPVLLFQDINPNRRSPRTSLSPVKGFVRS